jgi:protocatechuate 3,4-dioxygenase alpha subunit
MLTQTGSQTVGPFFRIGMIRGGENTLVQDETVGERIYIKGQLFDGDNQLVDDAAIEIWQADADPNQARADQNFRGFGRSETRGRGFWFRTVKPGIIPGTTAPYINVRVFSRGMLIHAVTRLYFDDESANTDDPVLNSVPTTRRSTLIAQREATEDIPTYRFDIHLQGEQETVFFDV